MELLVRVVMQATEAEAVEITGVRRPPDTPPWLREGGGVRHVEVGVLRACVCASVILLIWC